MTTLKPTNVSALKSDDLKGADVIDRQGNKIASIDDSYSPKTARSTQ